MPVKPFQVKRTKLILLSIVIYKVCWTPYTVLSGLLLAYPSMLHIVCAKEYTILLGYINACLHCIVICLGNKKYRDAFKLVLCGCRKYNTNLDSNNELSISNLNNTVSRRQSPDPKLDCKNPTPIVESTLS